jgi:acyl-CoA synthetase (AMP-forming)/AMP-acid ligase II
MQTFIKLITERALANPEAVAIVHGKKKISYGDLHDNMKKINKGASMAGLHKGDNVLFICKPDIEGLCLALGLLHAGITVSIIDPFTSDDLFMNRCKSAQVTHVIAPAALYNIATPKSLLGKITRMQIADINNLEADKLSFGSFLGNKKIDAKKWLTMRIPTVEDATDEDSSAIIVFTSGTTSEPKGVVHSFRSLSSSISATAGELGVKSGSRVYSEPMTVGLVALSVGAEWIIPIPGEKFPKNCDVWFGTPKEILDGLDIIEKMKTIPDSMKTVAVGAAPVLPSLVDRIEQVFDHLPMNIKTVYGMTEMLPIAIGDAKLKKELAHLGDYIGKPLPSVKVEVAADGEVFISGSSLCKGYSPKPDETGNLIEVSPLGTGDIGEVMENGHLILKGRKKEMFIRGSMNVYPGLYEPALSSISGVKQAVIVGIPDEFGDDEIVLAVLPVPSADKEAVKIKVLEEMSKHMDKDAIPTEVFLVESLPVSGRANKLDRTKLLSEMTKLKGNK